MSVVTFTKQQIDNTNPFDGTVESTLEVHALVDDVPVNGGFSFPPNRSDAQIQAALEADLAARGLFDGPPTTTKPPYIPSARFLASSKIVDGGENGVAVASIELWTVLGGVVTTPSFFTPKLTSLLARVVGQYKGAGQFRVIEEDPMLGDVVMASYTAPDSTGLWVPLGFSSSIPPRAGSHAYRLEARLDDSESLAARFVSMSLLELV